MPRPQPNRIVAKLSDTIPFVAPEELERQMGKPFLARLGANESVFGASPKAIAAMAEAAQEAQWYGDPISFDLRTELAKRFGTSIDHFVVGPGIDGLFAHIASAFWEPKKKIVTTLGSYPTFNYFVESVGAELIQVPYYENAVDLVGLANAALEHRANAVYVANPDNPSGHFHGVEEIRMLLEIVPDSTLVILDEAYIDFVEPYDISDPRLIRLRTFSKAYGMAGARVAFAFGEPETVQPLNRIRAHFEVNRMAQAGAMASLADDEFLNEVKRKTSEGRTALRGILEENGFASLDSSTNFVLGDAGSRERAEAIVAKLREHQVFIRKPGQPPLDGFIRVTVGTEKDHEVFADALRQCR